MFWELSVTIKDNLYDHSPPTYSPPTCPEDDEPIGDGEVRVDRGCLKELKILTATCPGDINGCPWRGNLDDLFEVSYKPNTM